MMCPKVKNQIASVPAVYAIPFRILGIGYNFTIRVPKNGVFQEATWLCISIYGKSFD